METENNGLRDQDQLDVQAENPMGAECGTPECEHDSAEENRYHKHRYEGNKRYRMFSNHSSANDMPHTNTSF